ncbi:MAG: lipoprotein insertase outer membrane protein LolB [Rhodoferax sp.]|nr:lipoprotein insertase outer membrane protein LolB [Rhodoferax sp.]
MICRRFLAFVCALFAIFLVAGCAYLQSSDGLKHSHIEHWSGRLSVRTLGEAAPAAGSATAFQAAFALEGNAKQGELLFFTPLGSTAASIRWTPQGAELIARGETRQFGDLQQLINQAIGTDLPVAALFFWLSGRPQDVDGWQADLSNMNQGKMTARRNTPEPVTELRLVLDSAP